MIQIIEFGLDTKVIVENLKKIGISPSELIVKETINGVEIELKGTYHKVVETSFDSSTSSFTDSLDNIDRGIELCLTQDKDSQGGGGF